MQDNWQKFLTAQQLSIIENRISTGHDPADEARRCLNENVLTAITQFGLIQATGNDCQTFLQGQLSNDVKLASDTRTILAAYCSAKGRMLADFRIIGIENGYLLQCPAEILASTLQRLRMFILSSDVRLEDASDALCSLGISGPDAQQLLAGHIASIPTAENQVSHTDGIIVVRLPGHQPRFMVIGSFTPIADLWETLKSSTSLIGSDAWDLHDVSAAIPHISTNTVDSFVPQMVNLHAIDGISFTKGCYTGQEVVARMRYLGKLKRRMYRGHIASDSAPAAGDPLFSAYSQSGQGTGRIVTALPSPEGGYEVLAVIEIAAAESDTIHWQATDGTELVLSSIPYEVPVDKNG